MTARQARGLARLPALAGILALGLSVGQLAAPPLFGTPVSDSRWATLALALAFAFVVTVGALWLTRRSTNWRCAAVPGCTSLLVLVPSLARDGRPLVTVLAVAAALSVTVAGWLWRTGRQALVWVAVPAGLAAALCLAFEPRLGLVVALAAIVAVVAVAVRRPPGAVGGAGSVLAASMALCLVPLAIALRVRFTVAGGVVGGYDLAWGRHLLIVAAMAMFVALLFASRFRPGWIAVPRARLLTVSIGLALLALATNFSYRIHTDPIGDREGRQLASLTAIDAGARPFRDLRVVDGLGDQVVMPAVATGIAGRSVRGLRLVKTILGPLDHALVVLLGAALLPPRWGALYGVAIVLGVVGPADDGRGLVVHLALLAVALALRARPGVRSMVPIALVGGVVGFAVLWRSDLGIIVGVAAGLGLALTPLPSAERWRRALRFVSGALVVVAIGVVVLLAWGASPERSLDVLRGSGRLVSRWWPAWAMVAAAVVVAATQVAARERVDRLALVACFVALTAGLGASGGGVEVLGVEVLGWSTLLLAMACGAGTRRLEPHLAALMVALLVVPVTSGGSPLLTCLRTFAGRGLARLDDRVSVDLPGAKEIEERLGVLLSSAQAHQLPSAAVGLRALTAGRPYFDFTDTPVLHFLSGVPPASPQPGPTRSIGEQRAQAAELRANLPDVVLFWHDAPADSTGGADLIGANHLVAEVIVANYRPRQAVGGFAMLTRIDPARAAPAVPIPDFVELGELARLLGERTTADDAPGSVHATAVLEVTPGLPVPLALASAVRPRTRLLDLQLTADESGIATLRWTADNAVTPTGVHFAVAAGTHRYRLPLRALPGWVWPATLDGFELSAPRASLRRVGWALIAAD